MELCDINLEEYLQGKQIGIRGLIDWDTARKERQHQFLIIAIMQQLLSGLAFIHGHDEVHRDMAPQNGIVIRSLSNHQFCIPPRAGGGNLQILA